MKISEIIKESASIKQALAEDRTLLHTMEKVIEMMIIAFKNHGAVYFCGNGGSAADAQHLAAELSGRYYYDRPPLASEALHVNTSYLTAVANDYSYDEVYARYIRGVGKPGDILVGISTSGNSANVVRAFEECKNLGITTVAMTGAGGGRMKEVADLCLQVPSTDTPRIQESHIMLGHILCQYVESGLFPKP